MPLFSGQIAICHLEFTDDLSRIAMMQINSENSSKTTVCKP